MIHYRCIVDHLGHADMTHDSRRACEIVKMTLEIILFSKARWQLIFLGNLPKLCFFVNRPQTSFSWYRNTDDNRFWEKVWVRKTFHKKSRQWSTLIRSQSHTDISLEFHYNFTWLFTWQFSFSVFREFVVVYSNFCVLCFVIAYF